MGYELFCVIHELHPSLRPTSTVGVPVGRDSYPGSCVNLHISRSGLLCILF
jgi:hypothetical protein